MPCGLPVVTGLAASNTGCMIVLECFYPHVFARIQLVIVFSYLELQ